MDKPVTYQIKVQGNLDATWSEWFSGMKITHENRSDGALITTLTGPVADQAALRGILSKIWDLNLTVISIARVDLGQDREESANE